MTYLELLKENIEWAEAAYAMVDGDLIAPRSFYHDLPGKARMIMHELKDSYKEELKNTLTDFSKFALTQGSNFSEYHYHHVVDAYLNKPENS